MDTNIKPIVSAQLPLSTNLQRRFVRQIDSGETYQALFDTVKHMAWDLTNQHAVLPSSILSAFNSSYQSNEMLLLMHSIPRPVLRSLAMRMMGFDFWKRDDDERKTWLYAIEGPGTYVVSMAIYNREGRMWTGSEFLDLIGHLETYASAVDAIEIRGDSYGNSQLSADDFKALYVARDIDGQYLTSGQNETQDNGSEASVIEEFSLPRFASSDRKNQSRNIKLLLETMRGLTITEPDISWLQSFTIVGNAEDVMRRVQDHRFLSSLSKTPKLWGLVGSCLKYMDLESQAVIVPICKAWKTEHINLGEILITVIAGSLVSRGGLNVYRPGTRSEKTAPSQRELDECRRLVLSKPWYMDNIRASTYTTRHMKGVQEYSADDHDIKKLEEELVADKEWFNQVHSWKDKIEQALDDHSDICDSAEKGIARIQEEMADVDGQEDLLSALRFQ